MFTPVLFLLTSAALAIVFIIYGMVLSHHWLRWALNRNIAVTASLIYFSVGGILLVSMFTSVMGFAF